MQKTKFQADNRRFGQVLTEVMKAHRIAGDALVAECGMHKGNIYQIKKA